MEPIYFVLKNDLDTYSIVRKKNNGFFENTEEGYYFETHVPDAGDKQTARTLCHMLNEDYAKRVEENKRLREEWEARQPVENEVPMTTTQINNFHVPTNVDVD